jgi:hypothetical protein
MAIRNYSVDPSRSLLEGFGITIRTSLPPSSYDILTPRARVTLAYQCRASDTLWHLGTGAAVLSFHKAQPVVVGAAAGKRNAASPSAVAGRLARSAARNR